MTFVDRLNVIAEKLGAKAKGKTIEDAIVIIEGVVKDKSTTPAQKTFEKKQKPVKTETKEQFFKPSIEPKNEE